MSSGNVFIDQIKACLLRDLANDPVKVYLFGSRARGAGELSSDVDIGFVPGKDFDMNRLTLLKEKIEHLNIPYTVDFVNLNEVDEQFRREVLKDAILWKDCP